MVCGGDNVGGPNVTQRRPGGRGDNAGNGGGGTNNNCDDNVFVGTTRM